MYDGVSQYGDCVFSFCDSFASLIICQRILREKEKEEEEKSVGVCRLYWKSQQVEGVNIVMHRHDLYKSLSCRPLKNHCL